MVNLTTPLSRLGLARTDALRKDFPAARREYETFFASWKDADPDLPILRDAKDEYGGISAVQGR